ncbi:hypothetical protein Mpal_2573 [Methanosphaerula palustris E1-9c]|uniref:Uncharacterized protein n=1 Tax=Methanosphaerula palustris (strain ATCC BAA-1556 / DSM 19958 / E1-9c) TaxID=521011 RepID=B8GF37_METPE|nr:hypothetical protein Mpal_2573 [Methanosphaerula palustris E1-9c]
MPVDFTSNKAKVRGSLLGRMTGAVRSGRMEGLPLFLVTVLAEVDEAVVPVDRFHKTGARRPAEAAVHRSRSVLLSYKHMVLYPSDLHI